MRKLQIDMSANISAEQSLEIFSEAVAEICNKTVKDIEINYNDEGKFDGFKILFSESNSVESEHIIDKTFKPIVYN
jgi:hypothetical protein